MAKKSLRTTKTVQESVLKDGIDFLTIEECANYLRVHYMTFYTWIQENKGPPVRRFTRQCIRVPKQPFLDWVANRSKKDVQT